MYSIISRFLSLPEFKSLKLCVFSCLGRGMQVILAQVWSAYPRWPLMTQGFLRCVQWASGTKSIICGCLREATSPAQVYSGRFYCCTTSWLGALSRYATLTLRPRDNLLIVASPVRNVWLRFPYFTFFFLFLVNLSSLVKFNILV